MEERVVDAGFDIAWDPNSEHAFLSVGEAGPAVLRLNPRSDDPDKRLILIRWDGVRAARMDDPNDEARSGHPLYDKGLTQVRWIGEVVDSALVAEVERRNRVHPLHDHQRFASLRHWVVLLKGKVVEIVASSCEVTRVEPTRRRT